MSNPAPPSHRMACPHFAKVLGVVQALCVVCGIIVACILTISRNDAGQRCLLFGNFNLDSQSQVYGSDTVCSYCLYQALVTSAAALLLMLVSCIASVHYEVWWQSAQMVVCLLGCLASLVAAVTLTTGYQDWCKHLLEGGSTDSCEAAASEYDTSSGHSVMLVFFRNMQAAQSFGWVLFLVWALTTSMVTVQCFVVSRKREYDLAPPESEGGDERRPLIWGERRRLQIVQDPTE
ncbi:Hypp2452 [Branchiostoma lanceolatum]|uniref:Hypp2452 protein n=2 Tax=Branchiostoma lanceolatum TaxID=7740 RepID=A0A8J9ZTE4_BRALA|nr:Hypp2452 [Branchiostoma lanceolatum]